MGEAGEQESAEGGVEGGETEEGVVSAVRAMLGVTVERVVERVEAAGWEFSASSVWHAKTVAWGVWKREEGRVVRESVGLTEVKKGQGWAVLLDPVGAGRFNASVGESLREFGVVMPCGCVFDHEQRAVVQVWQGGCPALVDRDGRGVTSDRGEEGQRLACSQRSALKDCGCWVA